MGSLLLNTEAIYSLDGKQYIAIASGTAILPISLFEPAQSLPVPQTSGTRWPRAKLHSSAARIGYGSFADLAQGPAGARA